ncbi:MAG: DUF58 domain-containing protein [Candidatus Cloacimonetes bacterium]|nr:DUF58 domain-containing protein [Candidatus Cloacimonadota bacterium]
MIDLKEQLVNLQGNLKFTANAIVEGFISGQHKSPYHGFSVEFSDYKPYSNGDSINLLDWKVYSKTDRYYIKRYEDETNVRAYFLLDISNSMSFTSHNLKKIDYAKLLVASLVNLSLKQRDATGLVTFNHSIVDYLPAKSSSIWFNRILQILEKVKCSDSTNLSEVIFSFSSMLKKRSLVIIITDFFDDIEAINKALNFLKFNNHHCILFHIFDEKEIDFSYNGEYKLIDLENSESMLVSPHTIRKDYLDKVNMFHVKLKEIVENLHFEYFQINTLTSVEMSLKDFLFARYKRYH